MSPPAANFSASSCLPNFSRHSESIMHHVWDKGQA
jgi:hypothetical protein